MGGDIVIVAGARPNFVKVAPVLRAFELDGRFTAQLIYTGQHHHPRLTEEIIQDLGLRPPDHHLGVGSAPPSIQIARILEEMDRLLEARAPRSVVVVGDVTSTLGAGLAAANRDIPLIHIEAGLRSRDWTMPEERNRVLVDRLSWLRFVTEPSGVANLREEGLADGTHLVGNCMIDSVIDVLPRARQSDVLSRLGLEAARYAVLTLHRSANVDQPDRLDHVLQTLSSLSAEVPIVFPAHPRTRPKLEGRLLPRGIRLVDPLGYIDFIALLSSCALALTDSGGIQEETTFLGVPCITLRPNTERPVTVDLGTNELVHDDPSRVHELGLAALRGEWKAHSIPELWDGRASERIVSVVCESLGV